MYVNGDGKKDFDDILATVSLLLKKPDAKFYTTYHQRSENRNIEWLLAKWGLCAREIPLNTFMDKNLFFQIHSKISIDKQELNSKYDQCMNSILLLEIKVSNH